MHLRGGGGRRRRSTVPKPLRIVLLLLALAGLLLLGWLLGGYVEPFRQWVEGLGVLGPLVFVLGYAAAVVAFVPGSALTLAGGAIFGVLQGTVLVFIAAVLGSSAAFVIARYFARGAIERRVAEHPKFAAIDRAIGREGRKIAFLLRLSPAIPFVLLNYALGLTRIRFADALLASLGMLPGTLLYVYLGSVAGDAASASAGGAELGRTLANIVGLAATALVTIYVTVLARRALREATAEAGETR
jgi:uncharacterized membrane protein YdjX (TVP38/TMEM64 family)